MSFDQSINQSKITKNLGQNAVHSDPDLILQNLSVLNDKDLKSRSFFPLFPKIISQPLYLTDRKLFLLLTLILRLFYWYLSSHISGLLPEFISIATTSLNSDILPSESTA